jgi:hypothetical protein
VIGITKRKNANLKAVNPVDHGDVPAIADAAKALKQTGGVIFEFCEYHIISRCAAATDAPTPIKAGARRVARRI